jgi:hypothetical protein
MNFKIVINSKKLFNSENNGLDALNKIRNSKKKYNNLFNSQVIIDNSYLTNSVSINLTEEEAISVGHFKDKATLHITTSKTMDEFLELNIVEKVTADRRIAVLNATYTIDTKKFLNYWKKIGYTILF